MPRISMDKKYKTRYGREVRVLCIDGPDLAFPVIAIINNDLVIKYTSEGRVYLDSFESRLDLIEDTTYADFKIDEPVMVRSDKGYWFPRHFAGISNEGIPLAWIDGQTSYTTTLKIKWDECRRPTEQELKGKM